MHYEIPSQEPRASGSERVPEKRGGKVNDLRERERERERESRHIQSSHLREELWTKLGLLVLRKSKRQHNMMCWDQITWLNTN
jgi:hypothetical protein